MSLHPQHKQDLKNSGLGDEIIEAMQVYSMPPMELNRFIDNRNIAIESALAFPYFDTSGNPNGFMRIKIFPSIKDQNGHGIKYLQPKNSTPHLYILPKVSLCVSDPSIPLYIVEGEKKTAKAVEIGLCAVGIGGIWNWAKKGEHELIDDFSLINTWNRKVLIVPDGDTWDDDKKSEHLRRGVYYLAKELGLRGAKVGVVQLG